MGIIQGGQVIEGGSQGVNVEELTFVETTGAGVYTGTVNVAGGATVLDVRVQGVALWDTTTSAVLKVGDVADDDGWWTAVDLKATDLLAGEGLGFAARGTSEAGAYLPSGHTLNAYSAAARAISAVITTVGAAGSAGRTRVLVIYALPQAVRAATKV